MVFAPVNSIKPNQMERVGINGFYPFVQTDEIHLRRKGEYLPNDTLTIQCKMWTDEGDFQIAAGTHIITEHISFLHAVESFSILQPNVKKTTRIQSHLVKGSVVSSSLCYTDGFCGEERKIVPSDAKKILYKCKLSLLGGSENIIEYDLIDYSFDAERISIHKLPLSLTRQAVLNRNSEYLPNDKFSLLCKCTLSTGLRFNTIEEARNELHLAVIKQKRNHADNKDVDKAAEKISEYTSALEYMKSLYIKQRLTDGELQTNRKSFPAHKIVLCARSPVFEAMMTSDMKEKITACIQVDDLENVTVQQLLLFL
ncbi:hypothetical protein AVEN_74815-1 [Araneus ventricosus]|uniref:BTB domain-containing protein n=1 Tax=Araneus ventricosus TaxID=182803 RepID=A0A4Y2HP74_ARAVE|nr:hypothetical protein AVEN_74815-1 [Araneus ventricosus]